MNPSWAHFVCWWGQCDVVRTRKWDCLLIAVSRINWKTQVQKIQINHSDNDYLILLDYYKFTGSSIANMRISCFCLFYITVNCISLGFSGLKTVLTCRPKVSDGILVGRTCGYKTDTIVSFCQCTFTKYLNSGTLTGLQYFQHPIISTSLLCHR